MVEVFFDGSCIPNDRTGIPCFAFIVKKRGMVIHSDYGLAGKPNSQEATNSVAEYVALIKALEWLKENGYTSVPKEAANNISRNDQSDSDQNITIKGDSKLVINQVTGKFKVSAPHLKPLNRKAMSLITILKNPKFIWIPREDNSEADRLSYLASKEAIKHHQDFSGRF